MKKYFTKEVIIAITTIIACTILVVGIDFLKGINIMKPTNYYYAVFNNVAGLGVSSPVKIDGFDVGLVRAVEYNYQKPGTIVVEISLDKKLKLTSGSKVLLASDIMGTATLDLKMNPHVSTYLNPGDTIEGELAPDMMGSIKENILPQLEHLLPKIDSILTGIQTIVSNPALNSALNHIDNVAENLGKSSSNLTAMMEKQVPSILNNLDTVSSHLNLFSQDMKNIKLSNTINSIDSVLYGMNSISSKLNSKDNSLGLLLNDETLYHKLTKTATSADSLLIDLRLHPKRYVHFSLFGRK